MLSTKHFVQWHLSCWCQMPSHTHTAQFCPWKQKVKPVTLTAGNIINCVPVSYPQSKSLTDVFLVKYFTSKIMQCTRTYQYFLKASSGYGNLSNSSRTEVWPLMMQACKGSHRSTVDTLTKVGNFCKMRKSIDWHVERKNASKLITFIKCSYINPYEVCHISIHQSIYRFNIQMQIY